MKLINQNKAVSEKFIGLELIRFFSAVAIIFWHYQHFDFGRAALHSELDLKYPFYSALSFFYDNGLQGVRIFWCVSGFIFFWKYQELIAKNSVSSWNFFVLRFSRLYPLHCLTLLLVTGLQVIYFSKNNIYYVYQDNTIYQFLLQIFLASNWGYKSLVSFNGPIWSISVEVLVYFIFYLTCRIGGRSSEYYALLILVVSLGVNRLLAFNGINIALDFPLADCLVMFFVGGISGRLAFKHPNFMNHVALRGAGVVCVLLSPLVYSRYTNTQHSHTFLFLLLYLPVLFYVTTTINFSFSKNVNKFIIALGNLTYSSYLMHFPIQLLIAILFSYLGLDIPLFSKHFFIFYMLLVLVISYVIFHYFEKPAQLILRRKMLKI